MHDEKLFKHLSNRFQKILLYEIIIVVRSYKEYFFGVTEVGISAFARRYWTNIRLENAALYLLIIFMKWTWIGLK